jgi:hypothetical protein
MPDPRLTFSTGTAYYPIGEPSNWQLGLDLRRRPEQDGADVIKFGKEPTGFGINAVLFGATVAEIRANLRAWEALKGETDTLVITGTAAGEAPGIMLAGIAPNGALVPLIGASNGASYLLRIVLAFMRVAETSD